MLFRSPKLECKISSLNFVKEFRHFLGEDLLQSVRNWLNWLKISSNRLTLAEKRGFCFTIKVVRIYTPTHKRNLCCLAGFSLPFPRRARKEDQGDAYLLGLAQNLPRAPAANERVDRDHAAQRYRQTTAELIIFKAELLQAPHRSERMWNCSSKAIRPAAQRRHPLIGLLVTVICGNLNGGF